MLKYIVSFHTRFLFVINNIQIIQIILELKQNYYYSSFKQFYEFIKLSVSRAAI